MAERILLDTGVLVALINRRDPDHERCKEVWIPLRAKIVAVEGVLVEAAHLLQRVPGGARAVVDFVLAAGVEFRVATPAIMRRAVELMDRYHNVPMDWVDALLMCAAEELNLQKIFTLDERGFKVYRTRTKRALTILPG